MPKPPRQPHWDHILCVADHDPSTVAAPPRADYGLSGTSFTLAARPFVHFAKLPAYTRHSPVLPKLQRLDHTSSGTPPGCSLKTHSDQLHTIPVRTLSDSAAPRCVRTLTCLAKCSHTHLLSYAPLCSHTNPLSCALPCSHTHLPSRTLPCSHTHLLSRTLPRSHTHWLG